MAGSVGPSSSHAGPVPSGTLAATRMRLEEPDHSSSNWYFTREQIERDSPSRHDGIDLKRETYYRKSYCTFLQDLGMRLKVPQVTIATAIVFCHRFFLQQSHVKNDRYTIATACMFLAGKVEETPQSLKNVILMSYEIRNKKDPAAMQKIKQKDVYEQQKELVVLAERVVLATLGFDLNVHHPYKPLVAAIKRFKVAQNALAQVAWNFVNDGLRTSLCLQFKPHHIAAGAIFLAAKFLKVKLPTEGEVVWWQEFDVTPLQLEDVSNQMLELYEQNKPTPGRGSEVGGSSMNNNQNVGSQSAAPSNGASQLAGHSSPPGPGAGTNRSVNRINDETNASHGKQKEELTHNDKALTNNIEEEGTRKKFAECQDRLAEHSNDSQHIENTRSREKAEGGAVNLQKLNRSADEGRLKREYDAEGKKSWAVLDDLNKDRVKAALEKRRKSRGEGMGARQAKPKDLIDEDDLIERELESGVEAAAQAEKAKQERRESWARSVHRADQGDGEVRREYGGDEENGRKRKKSSFDGPSEKRLRTDEIFTEGEHGRNAFDNPNDYAEEGELPEMSPHDQTLSPRSGEKRSVSPMSNRLEKGGSPGRRRDHGIHEQLGNRENSHEVKGRYNNHHYHHSSHHNQAHRDERDRHHYKEREKLDREFKKSRHEYGK